jgi:tRNA-specific 2-thiouridylase
MLTQEQLARTLLPMGGLTKAQARRRAAALGLRLAHKPESQDICFVADRDYRGYLRRLLPEMTRPGPIVDVDGRDLGRHQGLAHYTVGQRKRLGLALGRPLYVVALDPDRNAVVVGEAGNLLARRVLASEVNMVSAAALAGDVTLSGQLRYRMQAAPCRVQKSNGKLAAVFEVPQRAITPGQAAVFYAGDRVACGGIIEAASGAE